MCETDSLDVCKAISNRPNRTLHVHSPIIEEIINMLQRPWNVEVKHVLREADFCADSLATEDHNQEIHWKTWRDAPAMVDVFLLIDATGTVHLR